MTGWAVFDWGHWQLVSMGQWSKPIEEEVLVGEEDG